MMSAAHLLAPAILPGWAWEVAVVGKWRRGCSGKLPQSFEQAEAVIIRRGRGSSYLCDCGHFHTSSFGGVAGPSITRGRHP